MENVDNAFLKKAQSELVQEGEQLATPVASITTREIQRMDAVGVDKFMNIHIPAAYELDAKPFIERPFFVDELDFTTGLARYSLIPSKVRFLPGDIARSNESLLNLFKMGAYGRPKYVLNVSMAGTITHAGAVLVGVLPPLPSYPTSSQVPQLINTILSGPHGILYANEATSISIPVPFYCNADLATLDMQTSAYTPSLDLTTVNGNYGTLVFLVLNPLTPSTGSSTSLKIVVEACFEHYQIVVPTPRFVKWVSQGRRKPKAPQSMINPVYDDFARAVERARDDRGFEEFRRVSLLHRIIDSDTFKVVALAVSAGGILVRLLTTSTDFVPQSGILSTAGKVVTGLFDFGANGLKNIAGDAIDGVRGVLRDWTGLHNPNVPSVHERVMTTTSNFINTVDAPQFFEKLDPNVVGERIAKEPIFTTDVDEMSISHITSKRQLIGTFKVSAENKVGDVLWIRPISPFQGGAKKDDTDITCYNNIELMHSLHRAWRGPLRLHITGILNNKQQVKLKVIKYYNPSLSCLTGYPDYKTVANAPSHLLEFTQGGQTHDVELPFLSRNELMPCADNLSLEALLHGVYYIYVAQPLATSDGSPTTIEFNVMMSAPDVVFYGYTKSNTYHANFDLGVEAAPSESTLFADYEKGTSKMFDERVRPKPKTTQPRWHFDIDFRHLGTPEGVERVIKDFKLDGDDFKRKLAEYKGPRTPGKVFAYYRRDLFKPESRLAREFRPESGPLRVMNEPQRQNSPMSEDHKENAIHYTARLRPNVDIRPLVRRMYKTAVSDLSLLGGNFVNLPVPLSSYVGENPSNWSYTPIETLSRMYYGKTCGFKIRIVVALKEVVGSDIQYFDAQRLTARIYYFPQNLTYLSASQTITTSPINTAAIVPPNVTSVIGEIPVTFQLVPRESNINSCTYEFVIPDTSFYKFLGGPDKFRNFSGSAIPPVTSTSDFGTFVIQLANNYNPSTKLDLIVETFVGLTDETRMGHHSIAPPFTVSKKFAYYTGNGSSQVDPMDTTLNPNLYKGSYSI